MRHCSKTEEYGYARDGTSKCTMCPGQDSGSERGKEIVLGQFEIWVESVNWGVMYEY